MDVREFEIRGPLLITVQKFEDERGFLSETYNSKTFASILGDLSFVQDNYSFSLQPGTIRGLHFQVAPSAQGKLIRVLRGSIFDVGVDIRMASPTFGKHVSTRLSSTNWCALWLPPHFAHGFCTLEPNTEILYKVTSHYSPTHERGLAWNDPALAISWPVSSQDAILSDKDRLHPKIADLLKSLRDSA
jgi:dTDP-4-dehydrorhamnose 3,5-epimerase